MKKNFIYNLILTGSNFLFPLITFPYATRVLGPEGLGICNFIISYNQTFIVIAALGIPIHGYREIARVSNNIEKRSKLFYELLFIHLSLSLLLLLIYIVSVFLIPEFRNYQMLALIGGVLIASNVFSLEWFFAGMSDFKFISIRSFLIKAVAVFTIFLFIKQRSDFHWYLIIYAIQFVLTASVNIYHTRKFLLKKINIDFSQIILHVRPIITLGIYLVMTGVYLTLPQTLLGFFHSEASVGVFYGAEKIIRMTIAFFTAYSVVLTPRLNFLSEEAGNSMEFKQLIDISFDIVITYGLPITFLLFLLSDNIILFIAGKGFTESIACLKIMSPIAILVPFSQIFCLQILNVYRKDKQLVFLSVLGIVISFALNIIYIPRFSYIASSYSSLITEFIVGAFGFILAKRVYNFHVPYQTIMKNIAFVLPFALITEIPPFFTNDAFLNIVISGALCGIYFVLYQTIVFKNFMFVNALKLS